MNEFLDAVPEHSICGEELGPGDVRAEYLWLVEPIDGARAFVRGYGMFSTRIALEHKGEIVVAISNAPVMEETAWAVPDAGSRVDGRRLARFTPDSG